MTQSDPFPSRPARTSTARTPLVLAGSLLALLALVVLAAGSAVVWLHGEQDADGRLSTGTRQIATPGAAVASQSLDLDLDGASWLGDPGDLGQLRVTVSSSGDAPVFAGVARTADVEEYLRDVAHATVTDFDLRPLELRLREEAGSQRSATPPADRPIWRTSVSGSGPQRLDWELEDGDWSVVVMNADGSPGVRAEVRGGVRIGALGAIGWGLLAGGTLLGAGAAALIVLGVRSPRPPASRPPAPGAQAPERVAQPAG